MSTATVRPGRWLDFGTLQIELSTYHERRVFFDPGGCVSHVGCDEWTSEEWDRIENSVCDLCEDVGWRVSEFELMKVLPDCKTCRRAYGGVFDFNAAGYQVSVEVWAPWAYKLAKGLNRLLNMIYLEEGCRMTVKQQLSLLELIDQALEGDEPDPHEITDELLDQLSDAHRATLVRAGLLEMVKHQLRVDRSSFTPRVAGPSRWSVARRQQRECVGGAWKFLDDCTFDDLMAIAAEYRQRAKDLLVRADEYEALADQLKAAGVATVGELRESVAA